VTAARKASVAGLALVILMSFTGTSFAKTYTVKARSNDTWRKVHTYMGKGDSVNWKNPDTETHDLNAYGGGWKLSEELSPGESVKKRFKKKGTFRYRCVVHSGIVGGKCQGMCGFVHVL
jgi:plastocyanin